MDYKRDNWTNKEIIKILEGQKLNGDPQWIKDHNAGVDDCIAAFYDFIRPSNESGAMAWSFKDGGIVHIGPILPR